jgi:hypothetical protein
MELDKPLTPLAQRINDFFESFDYSKIKEPIRLDKATKVTNLDLFIQYNVHCVNNRVNGWIRSYDHLVKLKDKLSCL